MNDVTAKLAEALRRIADPRNTHFAGDAQVVAREALAAYEAEQAATPAPSPKATRTDSIAFQYLREEVAKEVAPVKAAFAQKAATPAPAAPADPVTDGEQRAAFDAAFRAYEAERKYYDEGKGHWTRLAAAKERVWQSIAAAPAAPAPDAEAIRAIFQAGRDSYATPCIPMNSADEAWEEYAKEHGIGKKLSPNA